jgi:hypothetical protein
MPGLAFVFDGTFFFRQDAGHIFSRQDAKIAKEFHFPWRFCGFAK